MPEMKRNFAGGKMNKDVDERLVPNGEYRDAMNIQVSTSDSDDVGTVQNILGNTQGCVYNNNNPNPIPLDAFTVGSISDEKNDSLYWLISGQDVDLDNIDYNTIDWTALNVSIKDMIMRKTPNGCEPVFVDKFAFTTVNNQDQSDTDILENLPQDVVDTLEPGWTVTAVNNNGAHSNEVIITQAGGGTPIPFNYQYTQTGKGNPDFTGKLIINPNDGNSIPPNWNVGDEIHFLPTSYSSTSGGKGAINSPALSGCISSIKPAGFLHPPNPLAKEQSWPSTIEVEDCNSGAIILPANLIASNTLS